MTGQGGVPTMSFNGEPYFGQDRFNQLFWRLRQNGLTARKVPRREPIVGRPLRWPSSAGGDYERNQKGPPRATTEAPGFWKGSSRERSDRRPAIGGAGIHRSSNIWSRRAEPSL
jgi:hypothetical protein